MNGQDPLDDQRSYQPLDQNYFRESVEFYWRLNKTGAKCLVHVEDTYWIKANKTFRKSIPEIGFEFSREKTAKRRKHDVV